MKKLAIITTHPIQYYAPIFKLLHQRQQIEIKVFYTLGKGPEFDPGFGKKVSWDIPLTEGYPFEWVPNTAKDPGSAHFNGIVNTGMITAIENWQPDGLLVFGWAYKSHLKAIRYFHKKKPVYFRGDSTLLNEPGGLKKIIKFLFLTWVYKNVDHAFYVGQNNRAYFERYGMKSKQLSFAPHAIENIRFAEPRKLEVEQLRASLKLNEKDMLILFAGKFEPVKNVELLIDAMLMIENPDVHLLLVGNGILEEKLKYKVKKAGASAKIHFMDFKNQSYMPVLYQAADLFCLPSKSETWGLSINEAMACGKAILASDQVGCTPDLVHPGENGAVFKSGDVNDLKKSIQKLTDDKHRLKILGTRSAELIRDWDFLHIAAEIEIKLLNETH
jgi:glycosyltransferase involved in cell wall biosynthesis